MRENKRLIPLRYFRAVFFAAAIFFAAQSYAWAPGFVDIKDVIPEADTDIRYYGDYNFIGTPVDSYEAPIAIL